MWGGDRFLTPPPPRELCQQACPMQNCDISRIELAITILRSACSIITHDRGEELFFFFLFFRPHRIDSCGPSLWKLLVPDYPSPHGPCFFLHFLNGAHSTEYILRSTMFVCSNNTTGFLFSSFFRSTKYGEQLYLPFC